MTDEERSSGVAAYPPERHVLRDLDISTEQVSPTRSVSIAPVGEAVRNAAGAASVGFLAAVVDVNCALVALIAARPDWTATADLALHAADWLTAGPAVVDSRVLRAGANLVVVSVDVYDGQGAGGLDDVGDMSALARDHGPGPLDHFPRAAAGMLTFARIPRHASASSGTLDIDGLVRRRRRMTADARPPTSPLAERIGVRVLDPVRGIVELDKTDYVRNSFDALNGGVLGMVFEAAASAAVPGLVATDLQIHYLAQAKAGPARTMTRVLRRATDHAVCAVEMEDAGDGAARLAVATVTLQRPPNRPPGTPATAARFDTDASPAR